MSRCQFVAVYPLVQNHIRMGKLPGWRPRRQHERVCKVYMINFILRSIVYAWGQRFSLPSFGRYKERNRRTEYLIKVYLVYLLMPGRLIVRSENAGPAFVLTYVRGFALRYLQYFSTVLVSEDNRIGTGWLYSTTHQTTQSALTEWSNTH